MKIKDLQISYLEVPLSDSIQTADIHESVDYYRLFLSKVFTNEDLIGIGAQLQYVDLPEFPEWGDYVERNIKPYLVNEIVEPSYVEKYSRFILSQPFGTGVCPRPCCIEIALWDLIGKQAASPIYKLFGAFQDKVKAYASVLEPYPLWTEEKWVEFVKKLYQEGFKAVKLHIGWEWKDPSKVLKVVQSIRDALGSKLDIMIDAMQAWQPEPLYDLQTAIRYARELEKYNVRWLEEPLPHFNNPDLSAQLCNSVDIEIAGGGAMFGLHTFKTLLEKGALDIVQPDVQFAGGLSETRKIALLAKEYGKLCIPHCWGSGIALAATLQVIGSTDIPYVEYTYHPPAWDVKARDSLLKKPIEINEDGYVEIPQEPGLGIELNEDKVKEYTVR